MKRYLRWLIRLNLIYSYNLKLKSSIKEFYGKLNTKTDSGIKFIATKPYVLTKYRNGFSIQKSGKAGYAVMEVEFVKVKQGIVLKMRGKPHPFFLLFFSFCFLLMSILCVAMSIKLNQPQILWMLPILILFLGLPFWGLVILVKWSLEEIKNDLKVLM